MECLGCSSRCTKADIHQSVGPYTPPGRPRGPTLPAAYSSQKTLVPYKLPGSAAWRDIAPTGNVTLPLTQAASTQAVTVV